VEATVRAGCVPDGTGMLVNSSRAILYAGAGEDYAAAARRAALDTRDALRQAVARRSETPPADGD